MGGYAAFVWPAYGITAAVILGLIIWAVHAYRAARSRVVALEAAAKAASQGVRDA